MGPPVMWLRALHQQLVPQQWLQTLVVAALSRTLANWNAATGPAEVLVLTLRRVGWQVIDAACWSNHRGQIVQLQQIGTHALVRMLSDACQQWQWSQVALHDGMEGLRQGAVVAPLRKLLGCRQSEEWSERHQRSLRAVVTGQLVHQSWLHQIAQAESPLVASAGKPRGPSATGSEGCRRTEHTAVGEVAAAGSAPVLAASPQSAGPQVEGRGADG
eukprot:5908562-Alexandrium_andersonii.AAC.1